MSMTGLTMLQFVTVFLIYSGLTVALPALVLYPLVKNCRAVTRFFCYFTIGNFYLMNLVYLLQLLHISYWITLVAGTVIPALMLYVRIRGISLRAIWRRGYVRSGRLLRGTFGWKNSIFRTCVGLKNAVGYALKSLARLLWQHRADSLFVLLSFAMVLVYYGKNLLEVFGYCASDVSVHNYWINYLGKNQIFVAGVYPFGFHNIVYYIHAVFGIDTYVMLRVFWLVQTVWIHIVLLMLMKGVCKSRYLPYFGLFLYTWGGFYDASYTRYFASLPQEFGMLFIYPAVYFAFEFFRIKKEELSEQKKTGASRYYLMGFALSFAMSFSAHFYGTIILGLFCVGIACGYVWRFLQPRYFGKVVMTCLLGLFIALLPMVTAYLTGTLLEGSLRWAMGVMSAEQSVTMDEPIEMDENGIPIGAKIVEMENGALAYEDILDDGTAVYYVIDSEGLSDADRDTLLEEGYTGEIALEGEAAEPETPDLRERIEALGQKLTDTFYEMDYIVALYLFEENAGALRWWLYAAILATPVLALLLLMVRRFDEAFALVSVSVSVCLMMFLLVMPALGMPMIMQQSRTSIYLNYAIPLLWILTADMVLYLFFGLWRAKGMRYVMHGFSLLGMIAGIGLMIQMDWCKPHNIGIAFQSNEAVTCMTNIIREEPKQTWTIVSAYDEMRMAEDYGYHYELITFLKEMEHTGGISLITIPTETVYFFIEKRPLDYSIEYEGSGQLISEKGAAYHLPTSGGFADYMGENRWVVMSRFYEWAKAFQQMYPHEMQTYFENEDFVCYRLTQNPYHLFNLSIDYKYNM
ncbi:MAG: hypothetical protein J6B28_03825 [Eubacterium sp.]|nr:hypothetical protein [Eubacterium sp.]